MENAPIRKAVFKSPSIKRVYFDFRLDEIEGDRANGDGARTDTDSNGIVNAELPRECLDFVISDDVKFDERRQTGIEVNSFKLDYFE